MLPYQNGLQRAKPPSSVSRNGIYPLHKPEPNVLRRA